MTTPTPGGTAVLDDTGTDAQTDPLAITHYGLTGFSANGTEMLRLPGVRFVGYWDETTSTVVAKAGRKNMPMLWATVPIADPPTVTPYGSADGLNGHGSATAATTRNGRRRGATARTGS